MNQVSSRERVFGGGVARGRQRTHLARQVLNWLRVHRQGGAMKVSTPAGRAAVGARSVGVESARCHSPSSAGTIRRLRRSAAVIPRSRGTTATDARRSERRRRSAPRAGRGTPRLRAGCASVLQRIARPGRDREASAPVPTWRLLVRGRSGRAPRRRGGAVSTRPEGAPGLLGRLDLGSSKAWPRRWRRPGSRLRGPKLPRSLGSAASSSPIRGATVWRSSLSPSEDASSRRAHSCTGML